MLEEKINSLWATYITNFKIDILKHKIIIESYAIENNDQKVFFKIEFKDVSSYFFYNNTALEYKDYDFKKWDYAEIMSFNYMPGENLFNINSEKMPSNLSLKISYNILIEIWETELYIKAKKIRINNEEFELE